MTFFDYSRIEASRLEYKEKVETQKAKNWLKTVSAFANTNGGYIIFGVTDENHEAIGLDHPQIDTGKITDLITKRISPAPKFMLEEIPAASENRVCLLLSVVSGPAFPYYYVHESTMEAYIRQGDSSRIASPVELSNLILKGQNKTFDSLPTQYKLSDVSFTLLGATFKQELGSDFDMPRDLYSMGLLSESGQVTNAGLLLCDQGCLRQSRVVCTRWKGTDKGTLDEDALDDREYKDMSLISLLRNAEDFVRNNSKNPWTIRGMRREERSDYPFHAVREVLVNAMMHRDYQCIGAEIHIDMFDDRMEITSPGGMLNGSCIQDLDLHRVPSMRRNEYISDIFGRLRFMERRGSGIGRILNSYSEFVQEPCFYSNAYYFSVTLPNRSIARPAQMNIDVRQANQQNGASNQQNGTSNQQNFMPSSEQHSAIDWELQYFEDIILKNAASKFQNQTIENLISIFRRYRYDYTFNRGIIANMLGMTQTGASAFIRKCIDRGIIVKCEKNEYRFADPNYYSSSVF